MKTLPPSDYAWVQDEGYGAATLRQRGDRSMRVQQISAQTLHRELALPKAVARLIPEGLQKNVLGRDLARQSGCGKCDLL